MLKKDTYSLAVDQLAERPIVTIATGATCAYLGDERNLREFLIADETARRLRQAGHTVFSLLIDDSLDPLNLRQLRVAVNKDEALIQRFQGWCGRPIASLPDPWGCHDSYACHFEEKLLDRVHALGCHPTLISTAALYQSGVYAPYVRDILERYDEVLDFLRARFPNYTPDKLFWVLCPDCGFIDETRIERIAPPVVEVYCRRCERSRTLLLAEIQGKFNWKLDCALRWALFKIDAEPFSKAYLEPQAGSFVVTQALSERFFGGHAVLPLHYGTVKMDRALSYKLLDSLPGAALRALLVDRPVSDLVLTHDAIIAAASQYEVAPALSYLDFVKQLLPLWLLTPDSLRADERDLLSRGIAFSGHFLGAQVQLNLPRLGAIGQEEPRTLRALCGLLEGVLALRRTGCGTAEQHQEAIKPLLTLLGPQKKAVFHRLRALIGQEHGLPVARILCALPMTYLELVGDLLEMHLAAEDAEERRPALRLAA